MPNLNARGPEGQGSRTGRGLGRCGASQALGAGQGSGSGPGVEGPVVEWAAGRGVGEGGFVLDSPNGRARRTTFAGRGSHQGGRQANQACAIALGCP